LPVTLLADMTAYLHDASDSLKEEASRLSTELLFPGILTGEIIEKSFRKALRNGAWRLLSSLEKELILISRRWSIFRSSFITSVLKRILMEIELQSFKGKAIFFGALILISKGMRSLKNIAQDYILFLGSSYLNSPSFMRLLD